MRILFVIIALFAYGGAISAHASYSAPSAQGQLCWNGHKAYRNNRVETNLSADDDAHNCAVTHIRQPNS
jgi:hypothetical protein